MRFYLLPTALIFIHGYRYHLPSPSIVGDPSADATLINGKGRFTGGPRVDLSVVNIVYGKRYRFRLISISCDPNYEFSIDRHVLTIIEADGQNTKPLTVHTVRIFAGDISASEDGLHRADWHRPTIFIYIDR